MSSPINIQKEFRDGTFLIHGPYGSGKTHLIGDMLRTQAEQTGKPGRFINMKGEDGYLSIAAPILEGAKGVTVDSFEDLESALKQAKADGVSAIGLDGWQRLYPFTYKKILGSDRLPVVGGQKNEWSEVHRAAEQLIETLRYYAPVIMCTAASDKSVDQLRGETHTTPNFPGRTAAGIGGMFDFVFYMESEVIGPNKIKRKLLTAPVSKMVVRYRLPRAMPTSIEMPEGPGGWTLVVNAINTAMKGAAA